MPTPPHVPFSLADGGPGARIERIARLRPDGRLHIRRRIAVLVAITWLPLAVAALLGGRMIAGTQEPFLLHYGVHARMLLGIPLLILADATLERVRPVILPRFLTSGIVPEATHASFQEIVGRAVRLRDSWIAAAVIWVLAGLLILLNSATASQVDELSWAATGQPPSPWLVFGAWWYVVVGRTVFNFLLGRWFWRVIVAFLLFRWIANLKLRLVPMHPDRVCGLLFVQFLTLGLAPVSLAISCVLCAHWAHYVRYHGWKLAALNPLAAILVAFNLVVFLLPLLPFDGLIRGARRAGLLDYGELVTHHHRMIEDKWLRGRRPEGPEDLLSSPELGPSIDVNSLYDSIRATSFTMATTRAALPILVATVLPMLPVILIEVPLAELVTRLAKTLL